MPLHDVLARLHCDLVAFLDSQSAGDFQVNVDHDHLPLHLSGTKTVCALNASGVQQSALDRGGVAPVNGPVQQLVHGVPVEAPAHSGHHASHDGPGDRVAYRIPQ